ncbi:hypothetical protein L7F22_029060 [Adiantum nelumboides]|nr:hypothetical protein [Adiantum nelumboides]
MKPNVVRAPENEMLIQKELEKQGDKELEPVTGPRPDTSLSLDHRVVPNTTDEARTMELRPVPKVEEPWPQFLWETIRNRKDKSATLQSTPILEIFLNNEFYPGDIQSLYGDTRTDISMDSKPQSLKTMPSFIDKDQNLDESDQEDIPKEVEAAGPSEYERSDEEDTSTPLEKKNQKPRSREQVLMDEAMARVEARRKELADARAAKAVKTAKPTTMEEARKLRMEKAKALQKERKRLEAEEKAQEEAKVAQAAQTQEKEIKEALSRKAEEPILEPSQGGPKRCLQQEEEEMEHIQEPSQGSPKRPRQQVEEEMEHIQADPIPSSPMNIPRAPPSSPITQFPPASTPRTPPSPSNLDPPRSPPAPFSPQQQQPSIEPAEVPPSIQEETDQSMDKTEEEKKKTDSDKPKPAEIDLQIPLMQLEEPTHEEAFEEVKNFDYTKIILTLSRQFKCQQVVAKETDFQKERADRAYEEITILRTALELTAQHEAKVKQLELELAQGKANLELQRQQGEVLIKGKEAVRSLASTSQIHQAETHLHIQLPLMHEMPEFSDEENKIEDEGDMSQATQQVLPTIDEETPFHKGDAMSTQEVLDHESDFVAQKPSNDMNKGSENMLPTIRETQIHDGNTRNSEEKMVKVENQSDVQTSPKPLDDMIIKNTYNMPLRDEKVKGSEKKDEANEEHQGALATTEVQDKVDKGTVKATRNANKAQSIQGREGLKVVRETKVQLKFIIMDQMCHK